MATKTLYLENVQLSVEAWRMSESAPAVADEVASAKTGKTPAGNYFCFRPGVSDNNTYGVAFRDDETNGPPIWRSQNKYSGSFASGNWTITYKLKNRAGYAHAGRIYCRVYRTSADDPTLAQLTKMHSADGYSAIISFSATAGEIKTGTFTVNCDQNLTLTNDYLAIIFNWYVTTAGGNNNAGVKFMCNEGAAEKVDTADYTPSLVETITANTFPMHYLDNTGGPARAEELVSKVSGETVATVARNFPHYLIRSGKAEQLTSKWS